MHLPAVRFGGSGLGLCSTLALTHLGLIEVMDILSWYVYQLECYRTPISLTLSSAQSYIPIQAPTSSEVWWFGTGAVFNPSSHTFRSHRSDGHPILICLSVRVLSHSYQPYLIKCPSLHPNQAPHQLLNPSTSSTTQLLNPSTSSTTQLLNPSTSSTTQP